MTLEQIKAFLDLGGTVAIIVLMGFAIKHLWAKLEDKDKEITTERDKREELVRDSVEVGKTVIGAVKGIAEAIERLERSSNNHGRR